jgi:hypothetical protein
MPETTTNFIRTRTSKIIFGFSILIGAYWMLLFVIGINDYSFYSPVLAMLWIPMTFLVIIAPFVSLIFFILEKFNVKSLYLYSLLITVTTFLLLLFAY